LFKGFIRAYYVGTHTADVQLAASPHDTIPAVRVATDIPAADCVADRECTVLFFGAANCQDAVAIAVQGALPSAGGGGVTDHGALTGLGDDDHTQYQKTSQKGAASGYMGLDASSYGAQDPKAHGAARHTGTIGYVDVQIILPVTDTLAVGDDKSPRVPIRGAISSIANIYLRSTTAVTATFQVEAFNQAGTSQWTETISPSAELYKLLSGLSRSLADTDYVRVDITAYTSGGSNVLVVIQGKRAVTAT
jgi:hypothetical protein